MNAPRGNRKNDGRAFRVLVVDDQIDVADALGGLLRSLGHDVNIAYDARGALELARQTQPEIAILDLSMPDMSGYDLGKLLRSEAADLRLLALSGFANDLLPRAGDSSDFERVLTKPPDIDALLRSLRTVS